jgi:hypothetical protein
MKNQYVGDINDYVKFAFLRNLMRTGSEVMVCWMLTSDDGGADGNRRGYLDRPEQFRHHDPALFDALVFDLRGARNIKTIEVSGILPKAHFLSDPLEDSQEVREAYFRQLFTALAATSLVFFDPDNGLDVPSVPFGRRNSSKYLYRRELTAVLEAGHSAVVYQHFPRVERQRFVTSALESCAPRARDLRRACVRTPHVAYLLFLQDPHAALLGEAREFACGWAPTVSYLELARDLEDQHVQEAAGAAAHGKPRDKPCRGTADLGI